MTERLKTNRGVVISGKRKQNSPDIQVLNYATHFRGLSVND